MFNQDSVYDACMTSESERWQLRYRNVLGNVDAAIESLIMSLLYSVDRVDVEPEIKKRAKKAPLACAAPAAHCSISSAISTLSTLYQKLQTSLRVSDRRQ